MIKYQGNIFNSIDDLASHLGLTAKQLRSRIQKSAEVSNRQAWKRKVNARLFERDGEDNVAAAGNGKAGANTKAARYERGDTG